MAKGVSLDDVPTGGGSRQGPSDVVDIHTFGTKLELVRLVEPLMVYGNHTIQVTKKDGSKTRFSTPCLAWDHETNKRDSTKPCPWCKHAAEYPGDKDNRVVQSGTVAFANGFARSKLANPPERTPWTPKEKKTGYKDKESDTETIWEVFRLTTSVLQKLKEAKQVNVVEMEDGSSQNFSVMHREYGADVRISHDKTKAPALQYSVLLKEGTTPIKKGHDAYPRWNLEGLFDIPTFAEEKEEYIRWAERNKQPNVYAKARKPVDDDLDADDSDDGFPDDDDYQPVKPRRSPAASGKKPTSKRPPADEFDDDDLEDEPKRPSSAKQGKRPSKPEPEELGDGDDLDDDDDGFEETPPARKPSSKPGKTGRGRPFVDDDDLDPDDGFDDDQDDEPAPPKKPGKRPSKPAADEFDDDDLDSDDADDQDPDPPPRKPAGKKPAASAKPSGKKPRRPDPEEEEDDWEL